MKREKKNNSIVYSTNPDFNFHLGDIIEAETLAPNNQKLIVSIEKKGRGGKVVTLIDGFIGSKADCEVLAKAIKAHCASGGSIANNNILIQGDFKNKITVFLLKLGYSVKKIGS